MNMLTNPSHPITPPLPPSTTPSPPDIFMKDIRLSDMTLDSTTKQLESFMKTSI